jgi:hypothetical protein
MSIELYQLIDEYENMNPKIGMVWSNISDDTLNNLVKKARGKLNN